jgi:hypothetical protein
MLAFLIKKGQTSSCGNLFEWNHDESNKVKSGTIEFLLENDFEDLELEVVFAFPEFPIFVEDKPNIGLTEKRVVPGLGQILMFDVFFNLNRKIPSIVRIRVLSPSKNSQNILCKNLQYSKAVLQIHVSILLKKIEQSLYTPIPAVKSFTDSRMVSTTELPPLGEIYVEKPVYECSVSNKDGNDYAIDFSDLNLSENQPHFKPSCKVSENLVKGVILIGQIHTLTSDICDKYQEITLYDASTLGLERIHSNALHGCRQLENLNLGFNKLTTLPQDLFKYNELVTLDLSKNNFRNLDGKIFQFTPALEKLDLDNNQFETFPFDDMPVLPNLSKLSINSNNLKNFNATLVMEKFPKLADITMENNNMSVHKMVELTFFFKSKKNILYSL